MSRELLHHNLAAPLLAFVTGSPLVFPSLSPAYLLFFSRLTAVGRQLFFRSIPDTRKWCNSHRIRRYPRNTLT